MSEKYSSVVKLDGISADVLRNIVNFLYTGKILLTDKNVLEVMAGADYLLIESEFSF